MWNEKTEKIFKEKKTIKNAKVTKRSHAYKCYARIYNVEILNSFNSELQLENIESSIRNKLIDQLTELKWFKSVTTLALEFKKIECDDETKYSTSYSASKAETIVNENDIELFIWINTVILNIQRSLKKSSGWIIDSVADHTINILK